MQNMIKDTRIPNHDFR